jgi:uncharacterized membrane protein YqiK
MPVVKAGPNEYLLIGRGGRLENRGSAVQLRLRPGTVTVVVPGAKQEAVFEFTQETKDGIPLRFKGLFIYRITDPVAAASLFDFVSGSGVSQITTLLTHVCLGELRHAVSHMTMAECIEERKTTLTVVADTALRATIKDGDGGGWGVTVEVAQLSQVFVSDPVVRAQLEAEARNAIKLRSDQSAIVATEETRLTQMASDGRVSEQKHAGDQETLRREEAMELAGIARQRRMRAETIATERAEHELETERFRAEMAAHEDRLGAETPVRLLRIAREREVLAQELEMRRLQNEVKALDVDHELLLPRARQAMRLEILPLEQAPRIVKSASRVLSGTSLSVYGDDGRLMGQVAPILELVGRAVRQATAQGTEPAEG